MNAYLILLATLSLGIFSALPVVAAENAKETAYERVIRTGTLRCGYLTYPPLLMKDLKTGEMSGVAHDIMTEIGKRLSLDIEWTEEVGTDVMLQGIASGRYESFCVPMYVSSGRARVAYFSSPLYFSTTYIVTRADDHRFDANPMTLNDPQYKIATLEGEITSILAKQYFPKASAHSIPQIQGYGFLLKDVAIGKADATISDVISVSDYNKENDEKLRVVEPPFFKHEVAVSLPQDPNLKSMIDITIHEMLTDGWLERTLEEKYPDYWKQVVPVAKRYQSQE
ncbi:MAG: transporter substrate-binding domain-containing protein [Alphaproteobacteria bacterium]|nr:transporter substrate-binding domain-containing protein [Alphaproteobacteria bacterium]